MKNICNCVSALCITAAAVLATSVAGHAAGSGSSRASGFHHAHAGMRHRDFGLTPWLYWPAWGDSNTNYGTDWPTAPGYSPPAIAPSEPSHFDHWVNTSAYQQEPVSLSQPGAKVIENQIAADADHDRQWVERCHPRIWFDDEGVLRYHYADGVKGCAAGQWID